jgi:RNA recognition motif-containing protein
MKKINYLYISLVLALSGQSCEKNNSSCIEGIVIGREVSNENCGTGTLIQVTNNVKMGKEIVFEKNNTKYSNVIKVPRTYPDGTIFFNYRAFDEINDSALYPYVPCQTAYAIYDVPIYVITDYSHQKCPTNEN